VLFWDICFNAYGVIYLIICTLPIHIPDDEFCGMKGMSAGLG